MTSLPLLLCLVLAITFNPVKPGLLPIPVPIRCPIRGLTIKTWLPTDCVQMRGIRTRDWQQCGAACTKVQGPRECKAWTFKSGWCMTYKNGVGAGACRFMRGGRDVMAGYSGCEV